MKKHITTLFLLTLLVSFRGFAQVIPNGTLETWNNVILYEDPDKWSSPNQLTSILGVVTVTKTTDAADGTYAARLESDSLAAFGIVVPGAIGTGTIDAATQTFLGGFPLNGENPAGVIGYFKYYPKSGDTCLVASFMTHWDAVNHKRDTVAVALFATGDSVTSYTQFTAPFFVLMPGTAPDTALVICSASGNIFFAKKGTVMYVDDIDFTNAVGVNEVSVQQLSLYPNPADASFELNVPADLKANTMIISNISGSVMKQYNVTSGSNTVNTKSYSPGLYVCQLRNQQGKVVASGKFTVTH